MRGDDVHCGVHYLEFVFPLPPDLRTCIQWSLDYKTSPFDSLKIVYIEAGVGKQMDVKPISAL